MNISIIVCTHKLTFIPQNKILQPIFVGKENKNIILPSSYVSDDDGDNISSLNNSYCELTGLYWAWKNLKSDYIGLCHYRRYFSFKSNNYIKMIYNRALHYIGHIYYTLKSTVKVGLYFPYQYTVCTEKDLSDKIIQFENDISKWLANHPSCKLFALKPVYKGSLSNYYQFSAISGSHHLEIIRRIIKKEYPEILPYYNATLLSNRLYYANMIIMQKDLFNIYCNFIFSVLDKYNEILLQDGYYLRSDELAISRISGYMGELLTSSFILHYIQTNEKNSSKLLYQIQYSPQ